MVGGVVFLGLRQGRAIISIQYFCKFVNSIRIADLL